MLLAANLPTRRDSRLLQCSPDFDVRYCRSPHLARLLPWTTAQVLRSPAFTIGARNGRRRIVIWKTVKVR